MTQVDVPYGKTLEPKARKGAGMAAVGDVVLLFGGVVHGCVHRMMYCSLVNL
jgi:hypothetical protein